jgi:hypothetical protein
MEGLLVYEDTATIIASIYVEQEQSEKIFEVLIFIFWLGINSAGLSGTDKGLYDLGTYFGRLYLLKDWLIKEINCLAQLVRWLHASLSKKTDGYMSKHDPTIRTIFLLNNVNYLLKRLENSPLLAIIQRYQPDLKSKYEDDFKMSLKDYTKWYFFLMKILNTKFLFYFSYTPLFIAIQQMLEYDNVNRLSDGKVCLLYKNLTTEGDICQFAEEDFYCVQLRWP